MPLKPHGDPRRRKSIKRTWSTVEPVLASDVVGAGGTAVWGSITGLIGDQTDLTAALAGKAALVHTHTSTDITNFSEAVDDRVASLLLAGSNVTLSYNDGANTLTVGTTGLATSASPTFTGTMTAASATFSGFVTFGSGDLAYVYGQTYAPAQVVQIRRGTVASPDGTVGAPLRVERTLSMTAANLDAQLPGTGGDGVESLAAIVGVTSAVTSCQVQPVGVAGMAKNDSTSPGSGSAAPDAAGLYGVGKIEGSGIGCGIGGYFAGRCDNDTGQYHGVEVQAYNGGTAARTYLPAGYNSCGLFMVAAGSFDTGTAISITNPLGRKFQVGIGFHSANGGATTAADIRSDSSATAFAIVNGTRTDGIDLTGATLSGYAVKLANAHVMGWTDLSLTRSGTSAFKLTDGGSGYGSFTAGGIVATDFAAATSTSGGGSLGLICTATPSAANHTIGRITFVSASTAVGGSMVLVATEAHTGSAKGTKLRFSTVSIGATASTARVEIDETAFNLTNVTGYSFSGSKVVGARKTGWAVDTGTAKRTANATYTPGATLTFSAGYVQAEHTATATRLAAVEAALRDAMQTIKALKDDLHATAGHGLIGT